MYFNKGTNWRYDVNFNPRRLNPEEGVPGLYPIGGYVHTRAVLGAGENRNVLWLCWESSPESSVFQHVCQYADRAILASYSVKSSLNYTAAVEYAGNIATLKETLDASFQYSCVLWHYSHVYFVLIYICYFVNKQFMIMTYLPTSVKLST
jgi:hypothetical protein